MLPEFPKWLNIKAGYQEVYVNIKCPECNEDDPLKLTVAGEGTKFVCRKCGSCVIIGPDDDIIGISTLVQRAYLKGAIDLIKFLAKKENKVKAKELINERRLLE